MIQTGKLTVSRNPYAVDLSRMLFSVNERPGSWRVVIPAVWFRRKREGYNGPLRTVACMGTIRDDPESDPGGDPALLMAALGQRWQRVEGNCLARWDGSNLWSLLDESDRAACKDVLTAMLAGFPAIPDGYSGWWCYK